MQSATNERHLDGIRLARLRWRCRRGMLENDLILARFLDAAGASLTENDIACLDALLDLPDNALWDVLSGRAEVPHSPLAPFVARLRALRCSVP